MSEPNPQHSNLERKLELIVQTGLQLTNNFNLESIVQSGTDAGLQLCGAQFGAFFYNVLNDAGDCYLPYALSGIQREHFANFPMARNTLVFGPAFDGTTIVRSDDITKDPRYAENSPFYGMQKGHLPVRSYLAVPVKSHSGEMLGGLFYGHEEVGVFEESSEILVAAIAAQAAVAIENARLREQLTRRLGDLQQAQNVQKDAAKHLSELAAIVASSDDAIISKDLNGIITSWNNGATRILGYDPEEMVGQSILKLIPEELHSDEPVILGKIRSGERIDHFETIRLTRDERRLEVSLTVSPVRDDTGEIVGASKILRDISSQKRMERSLLQAEKIAATGRMAATIAHEINNPLEAVVNLLYLVRASVTDPKALSYLDTAERELDRVSHIARQTLGFYRENASASQATITRLAQDAITVYEPRSIAAGITIVQGLESTRKIVMRKGEMIQVISNLITNSIYAMPKGGTLTITTSDVELPKRGVLLIVEDSGTGIAAKDLPHIFDAFFTTRSTIGTGIGLFVAKQFVEGHGGTITASTCTEPRNHGTIMTIFLPAETTYASA